MARRLHYMMSEAYNLGYDDGYKDCHEECLDAGSLETRRKLIDKAKHVMLKVLNKHFGCAYNHPYVKEAWEMLNTEM